MRTISILLMALSGIYMIIRSVLRFLKRIRNGVNVCEDPGESESIIVDTVLFVLGVLIVLLVLFLCCL